MDQTLDDALSTAHIATQQEKLDAIFGITGGKSMDEFLDDLSLDSDKIHDTIESIDQSFKEQVENIESHQLSASADMPIVDMKSMEHSLCEIEGIVNLAKDVMRHVAQSILATPLIDSEAVQAYSKLIESIHISIGEFISVYKDKQNFINKIKFAMFDQQQKKDLLLYKHNLALEIIKAKDGPKTVEADQVNSRSWKQEEITKALDDQQQIQDEHVS